MKLQLNRWWIAAAAVGIHLSIGSVYAYSAWAMPLESSMGWTPTQTTLAFSIAIFFLGVSAAFLGKLIERKGPRFGGLLSAVFFSSGLVGSGLACELETLWLFYVSFGLICGVGLGLGYVAPIATLLKWFPDRRGLAGGLAIMGFGFGGLVCTLLIDHFVPGEGEVRAVAEAPSADLRPEGEKEADMETRPVYRKEKVVRAFYLLGLIYACVMIPSALMLKPPPAGYGDSFASLPGRKRVEEGPSLTAAEAMRRPEFYGLWLMLFLNVSCGIAVIATAKKMGYEMVHLPVKLASLLVMGISVFNGLGRLIWAAISDRLGRPNTYVAFFVIQLIAFPLLAKVTGVPLVFMLVTFVILSCYGGGFSCIPAYIHDLFGLKELPTIQGYMLTAWSLAGFAGPMLNARVYAQTHSYSQSLYIFGGVCAAALGIALWMRKAVGKESLPVI